MAEKIKTDNKEHPLLYKGRPLARCGRQIYYGDMSGPCVALLRILDTADFADLRLPSRVSVTIMSTDEALPLEKRIIKKPTEKKSLYEAIDIASIWLERENA